MARDARGFPVALMAAVPLFGLRVGVEFLRFQSRRRHGVLAFRRLLLENGMDPDQAAHLSKSYHEAASLRALLGAIRRAGQP